MPISKDTLRKYLNPVFVETGMWLGEGIQAALDAGFKEVHSIEINPKYHSQCVERFKGKPNVRLHLGDSFVKLAGIARGLTPPATYWLDAHPESKDLHFGEVKLCPIIEELDVVCGLPGDNIVLIDDMPMFRHGKRSWGGITDKDIEAKILSMGDFEISYDRGVRNGDIMVARRK
jgi:hypothetical protein